MTYFNDDGVRVIKLARDQHSDDARTSDAIGMRNIWQLLTGEDDLAEAVPRRQKLS